MTPVATPRRAGLWLAPVSSALLLVAIHAATPAFAIEGLEPVSDPAAAVGEASPAVFHAGLKPVEPARVLGSRLRFDRRDASAEADGDAQASREAPRYEKGDYSLGSGASLGLSGSSFRERGMASWYGKAFHGRKTSSGDSFDMYALTAAHPTLPIPSYVRVTNLDNGKSAVVRINDRGPHHGGRIIDLSYAAAYKLGYADKGSANVELSLVLPEGVAMVQGRSVPPLHKARAAQRSLLAKAARNPARGSEAPSASVAAAAPAPVNVAEARPAASEPVPSALPPAAAQASAPTTAPQVALARAPQVFLQLGVFQSLPNAEQFKNFVEHELAWLKESVSVLAADGKYRLSVGPFTSAPEARDIAERIANTLKLKPYVIQR